jgi:protein-disulfide isomerase
MSAINRSVFFAMLALVALILMAACGGGVSSGEDPNEQQIPFVGDAAPEQAAVPTPQSTPENNSPAGDSAEVDANGVPVGFTEDGRPYRGQLDAPVVMEAFSDFQCPYCGRFSTQTLPGLIENQIAAGEVVLIFYDFPLNNIHPQAAAAANAARCAGEQGAAAYWAMHDRLFESISDWSISSPNDVFRTYAADLGLEALDFGNCLDENRHEAAIAADLALGESRGVNSTPSFFLNDQPVIGAYPLDYFNEAISLVMSGEAIAAEPEVPTPDPSVKPTPVTVIMDDIAGEKGDPSAAVTVVEYTDYQCPYCARHAGETLPRLLTEMVDSGRIRYIVKDFPLDNIHPQARVAAVAARCAGEQEAYWHMHDLLFTRQAEWSGLGEGAVDFFAALATELNLDAEAFATCQTSGRHDDAIQANLDEALALGMRGTPAFFINGFPVSGAQPFELFDYAITLAEEGTLADAYVAPAQEPTPEPTGPVEVEIGDAYGIGAEDAPVVIVEFTDFQCPFCSRHFAQTFSQLKADYVDSGKVHYIFKDFPLSNIHPQAQKAAEAARCAGDQGAYETMHGLLFSRQEEWSGRSDAEAVFATFAESAGLDVAVFEECLSSGQHAAAVQADLEQGIQLGVNGTPAFFLNGNFLSGAQPYEVFREVIEGLLAEQES